MKKISSKRKAKARMSSKVKKEAEKKPEDEFSELEKEMMMIRVNELERKVNRKRNLCASLKEENKLYKKLYDKEIKVEKNNTKLLNSAYEELATEILLLKIELISMEQVYNKLLEDKEFCVEAKEKVKRLTHLKTVLSHKLSEAENCPVQNANLRKQLDELQIEKAIIIKSFEENKSLFFSEFEALIRGVQDDTMQNVQKMMDDKDLKINLLHVPYQGLFLCGIKETSYLDFALNYIHHLLIKNIQLEKELIHIELDTDNIKHNLTTLATKISLTSEVLEYIHSQSSDEIILSETQVKEEQCFLLKIKEHLQNIEETKAKISAQEKRIARLEKKLIQQEEKLKTKEFPDKDSINNVHLASILVMAGDIIRREIKAMLSP